MQSVPYNVTVLYSVLFHTADQWSLVWYSINLKEQFIQKNDQCRRESIQPEVTKGEMSRILVPFGRFVWNGQYLHWELLQDLSEQEAKDFTYTLCPSTCNGRVPLATADANSSIVWFKSMLGIEVLTMPKAFMSANTMMIFEISGSSACVTFSG